MSYNNKAFWRRVLAFMLTVLVVIGSMPFSMQKVKAADEELSVKLEYIDADTLSLTPVVIDSVKLTIIKDDREYVYSALKDTMEEGIYKFLVPDSLLSAGELIYEKLSVEADGFKRYEETTSGHITQSTPYITYTLEQKKDGAAVAFAETSKTVRYSDLTDGKYTVPELNVSITPEDDVALANKTVTYSISGGNTTNIDVNKRASIDNSGIVSGLTFSESAYIITAVVSFDDYKDVRAEFLLTVNKGIQNVDFEKSTDSVTFDNNNAVNIYNNSLLPVDGIKEDAGISYEVDPSSTSEGASIDSVTGELTYSKAGSIKVNANIAGTDNYESKVISYTLTIGKQALEGVHFNNVNPIVTYEDNNNEYTQAVEGNVSNGNVTYKVTDTSGNTTDVATINSVTGKLSINKAGTVKVTADISETYTYGSASASYTLTIDKADRNIAFENNPTTVLFNDNPFYTNQANYNKGTGTVEYSIINGADIASVDSNGKVTYTGIGDITVKAYVSADDSYKECSDTYSFKVKYADTSEYGQYISLTGTIGDNNWYTSDVIVKAQDGYFIKNITDTTWTDRISITSDGIYSNYNISVKDTNGVIYRVVIPEIKIDQNAPQKDGDIVYSQSAIDKLIGAITFGFYKGDVTVTVSAKDEISGIKSITYKVTDESNHETIKEVGLDELIKTEEGKKAKYSFKIENTGKNKVKFYSTDNAGNSNFPDEFSDNKTVVIDKISPDISYENKNTQNLKDTVLSDNSSVQQGDDVRYIYNGSAKGTITVSDDYIDVDSIKTEIRKDGEAYRTYDGSEFNKISEKMYTYDYTLDEDGSYTITTIAKDYAENDRTKVWKVVVDTTSPDISVIYDINKDDANYISDRTATVSITDKNLRTSDISVSITAKDSLSTSVNPNVKIYALDGSVTEVKLSDISSVMKDSKYWSKNNDTWTARITFCNDAEYSVFNIECKDMAENSDSVNELGFTVDKTIPNVIYEMSEANNIVGEKYYYDDRTSAVITVKVTDEHFDATQTVVKDVGDGTQHTYDNSELNWQRQMTSDNKMTNTWVSTINVSGTEGEHKVSVLAKDSFGNEMPQEARSKVAVVDHTAPVILVDYKNGADNDLVQEVNGIKYYRNQRIAEISITETNFDSDNVNVYITAKDYSDNNVIVSDYSSYLKNPDNWTHNGDVHKAEITFNVDANYTFDIECTDMAGMSSADYTIDKFTIDGVAPAQYEVKYSQPVISKIIEAVTFGFYKENVIVTLKARDTISGIQKIVYSISNEDTENNQNNVVDKKQVLVDVSNTDFIVNRDGSVSYILTVLPQTRGKISFTAYDYAGNPVDNSVGIVDNNNIIVVDNISPELISVQFDEDNLIEKSDDNARSIYNGRVTAKIKVKEANFYKEDVSISAIKDGVVTTDYSVNWLADKDENGCNVCEVTFEKDGDYRLSINYKDRSGNVMDVNNQETYTSNVFTIDTTKPVVKVSYDKTNSEGKYVQSRTATITIQERNFRPDDVKVNINAKDISGNIISYTAPGLNTWNEWTQDADNIWKANIEYNEEAVFEFNISYEDMAKNAARYINNDNVDLDAYVSDVFLVAKSGPTDLQVVEISNNYKNTWNKILNAVTFGYYSYHDEVTVTIKATDKISGVKNFEWEYNREDGASLSNAEKLTGKINKNDIIYSEDKSVATAKFRIAVDSADSEQIRGNISFNVYNEAGISSKYSDKNRIIIIDTIAPDRTVTFSPAKQVVDSVIYYDDTVSARFEIKEANFYADDVNVYVNNELRTLIWNESEKEDTWYADMNISGDGDYIVRMTYTDRSNNTMAEYISDKIVVDTVNPVLSVSYTNNNIINDINGNKVFDSNQKAVITINEHNFRASDVIINIEATDINGNAISIPDYSDYLKNNNNWDNSGDVHTAVITFDTEANYVVNFEYSDLAGRKILDYATDYFTVDKSNPYDLSVSYSTSIIDIVLETVTFGFYNASVEVTVEVRDDISAINRIEYQYNMNETESSINADYISRTLSGAELTQTGNTAIVHFSLPQDEVASGSQINGTMNFVAYDNAGNKTGYDDNNRIVVDNIAPNATVEYSQPIQNTNGISYYSGDIVATITVNEANFYSEDVIVSVSNSGNYYPVNVQWTDVNADEHIGTFTISGDGDYTVSITYTDKSQNVMDNYTSGQMTIDTQIPTVNISNIKSNSANKDARYSFTISASDINFDASGFQPILKAVVKDASGNYSIKEIAFGTIREVEAGKTYSYTIDNLEEDAVYTLTCIVRDLAGNEYTKVLLEDGQEYDNVMFSINRNGSTFSVDKNTEILLNNYYVYEVSDDIVIYETNVDPVNNYKVKLNGTELKENTDYTTTMTNNNGEWAKRTYIISKNLFNEEGEYKVVVESIDKTNTSAYSDIKNMNILFTVDKTAPLLTVSGLENGGRYQTTEQEVTVLVTDDGGRINSFKVEIFNSSNEPISGESVRFNKSGEDLLKYLDSTDGKITFTVPEGISQKVVMTCSDASIHQDGSTNECIEQYTKITVSPSGVIIFYANKPLFYSIISAVILVMAGGIFLIIRGVRKSKSK